MSFMYKSIVSRAPGKRKIKLQEENILRLMQEDDDVDEEDDCDFKIDDNKSTHISESSSEQESSETSESQNSSSTSSEDEEPHSSNTQAIARSSNSLNRHKQKLSVASPSVQANVGPSRLQSSLSDTLNKIARQWEKIRKNVIKDLNKPASICCICLGNKRKTTILVCSRCGIAVHQGCYSDKMIAKHKKHWFCWSCLSESTNDCELCPSQHGCLQQTSTGQWCHVICARYILENNIHNNNNLIDFSLLNTKLYGSKECILCEDPTMTKTGICVKCDAGLCKSFFHVTCAQKYGLLSENDSHIDSETDPYFVYCPLHVPKENMTHSQKLYITAFESIQQRLQLNDMENHEQQTAFAQASKQHQIEQSQLFKSPPQPGEPFQRLFSSNAAAMRMFNEKAKKSFNINPQSTSAYFPRPSDVRKRHRVAPTLTPDFASHFVDRQLRIMEYNEHLKQSSEENQRLLDLETEYRNKYQQLQQKLDELKEQERSTLLKSQNLFTKFVSLKQWATDSLKNESGSPIKLKMEENMIWKQIKSPQRKRPSQDNIKSRSPKMAKTSTTLIKSCDICNGNDNQHMLIDCGICMKWFHLNCLDPPLQQMPRRTKFSLWQCEKCAPSSDSDSDDVTRGSLVTPDGRRITRRSHRPPDKLAAVSDTDIVQQQRMISYFSRSIKKSHMKKRIMIRKTLKKKKQVLKKNLSKSKEGKSTSGAFPGHSPTKSLIIPLNRNSADISKSLHLNKDSLPTKIPDSPEAQKTQVETSSKETKSSPTKPVSVALKQESPEDHSTEVKTASEQAKATQTKSVSALLTSQVVSKTDLLAAIGKFMPSAQITPDANNTPPLIRLQGDFFNTNALPKSKPILLHTNRKVPLHEKDNPFKTSPLVPTASREKPEEKTQLVTDNSELLPTQNGTAPVCKVCKSDKSIDKMMLCAKCTKYIHIWCSDPPLKFVPRTTKFCLWECSDCCSDTENQEDPAEGGMEQTPDGRKRITRRRKPPEKFSYLFENISLQKRFERERRRHGRTKKMESPNSKLKVAKSPKSPKKSSDSSNISTTSDDSAQQATTDKPQNTTKGGTFNMPLAVKTADTSRDAGDSKALHVETLDAKKNSLPSIIRLYSQMSNSGDKMYRVNYGKHSFGQAPSMVVKDIPGQPKTLSSIKQLLKSKSSGNSSMFTKKILIKPSKTKKSLKADKTKEKLPLTSVKDTTDSTTSVKNKETHNKKDAPASEITNPGGSAKLSEIIAETTISNPLQDKGSTSVSNTSDERPAVVSSSDGKSEVKEHDIAVDASNAAVDVKETPKSSDLTTEMPSVCEIEEAKADVEMQTSDCQKDMQEDCAESTTTKISPDGTNLQAMNKENTSTALTSMNKPVLPAVTTAPLSPKQTSHVGNDDRTSSAAQPDTDKLESKEPSSDDASRCDKEKPSQDHERDGTLPLLPAANEPTEATDNGRPVAPNTDSINSVVDANINSVDIANSKASSTDEAACNESSAKNRTQTSESKRLLSLPIASLNYKTIPMTQLFPKVVAKCIVPVPQSDSTSSEKKVFPRISAKQPEKVKNHDSKQVACATVRMPDGKKLSVQTAYTPVIPPSGNAKGPSQVKQDTGSLKLMENIVKSIPTGGTPNKLVTLVLSRPVNSVVDKASTIGSKELNVVKALKTVSVPAVTKCSPTTENPPP